MEIWKDVVGYEGLYQVSNLGRIKSLDKKVPHKGGTFRVIKGRMLKTELRNNYLCVGLTDKEGKRKKKTIHRIVCETFIKKVEGKDLVNHKDGNKMNNNVSNLEWCTHSENMIHAINNGLFKCEKKTVLTNLKTGERLEFESRRKASVFLTGNKELLGKRIKNKNKKYRGYIISDS